MALKRSIALLLLLLAAAAWPGRAAQGPPLRLGIYDNPPMTIGGRAPSGFIVDVIRDFARERGLRLEFVQAPFHELFDMLKRDKVDVIAPIAFSEERLGFLKFNSESVLIDWSNVIIGAAAKFTLPADLDGRRIGIVSSDYYARLFAQDLQRQGVRPVFREYDGFEAIVRDVAAGRVDAGFIGRFSLSHILKGMPFLPRVKVMPGSYYHEPLFFGINPRRAELAAQLDDYLRRATQTPGGRLNRFYEKWLGPTFFQRRLLFLNRNIWWMLLAVAAVLALFLAFNLLLRAQVRRSVREIHRQKTYFENLFKTMPAGIVILDGDYRVTDMNRDFERLFGYPLGEARGRDLSELINTPESQEQAASLRQAARRGERAAAEGRRRHRDGTLLDVHIIASPIVLDGRVQGILGIFLDITERKRMEEEIIKSKNIESVGVLAGGIAHDFNNMLTGILGNISVARKLAAGGPLDEILEKAERSALKASGLTRQLLTFSKGGYPVKKTVDLLELVRDSIDMVISGGNVRARLQAEGPLPPCEVDVTQAMQVINNLLLNAREAMPAGGEIDIVVAGHRQEKAGIMAPGDYLALTVRDHGPGIPEADLQRIFIPYFTTKKSGTGLGLAIAYSIVTKHGGAIQVRSEKGQGAAFTVYFPASKQPVGAPPPPPEAAARQARLLFMDDEEIVREVFADMLQGTPYQVDLAADSQEALEKFSSARQAGLPYDLVFLDLTGPGDIGGIKTLERIRAIDSRALAVAVSGYSVSEVSSHPGRYHFNDFLAKPFQTDELLEIIARNLPRTGKNS